MSILNPTNFKEKILNLKVNIRLNEYQDEVASKMGFLTSDISQANFEIQTAMNSHDYQKVSELIEKLHEYNSELVLVLPKMAQSKADTMGKFKHDLLEIAGWLDNPNTEQRWNYIVKGWRHSYMIDDDFVDWFFESVKNIDPEFGENK